MSKMESLASNDQKFRYDSDYARKIIDGLSTQNVVWVYERVEADGCDSYGPKALIYSLFIITHDVEEDVYLCSVYDAENWYDGEDVEYVCSDVYMSSKFSPVYSWWDLDKYTRRK